MTLYSYFDSKDALLDALVARTLDLPGFEPPRGAGGTTRSSTR